MVEYLTISEAAQVMGVSKSRVSQLISAGVVTAGWSGGRRVVERASAEHYRDTKTPPGRKARTGLGYTLMCADYEVARLLYDATSDYPLAVVEVFDQDRMPLGTVTSAGTGRKREFNEWWEHRSIPDTRPGVAGVMSSLDVQAAWQIPFKNFGLSLSDCYWVVADGVDVPQWAQINYFENDFAGSGDLEWDDWLTNVGLDSPDNTSEGELPKRWAIRDGARVLIKGSGLDDQRPFNEVVATVLHRRLLAPGEYVRYELVHVLDGPACACANFLSAREEYIPAAYIKRATAAVRGCSVYDRFCRGAASLGMDEALVRESMSKLIVCDAVIANIDRHWRNFGFIRNVDTLQMRPAPLFDSGNSLWYAKSPSDVARHDWSFTARPFGPDPVDQLALVDSVAWFDADRLDGFVDEAAELLRGSAHATASGRLDYLLEGLRCRVHDVSLVVDILTRRE